MGTAEIAAWGAVSVAVIGALATNIATLVVSVRGKREAAEKVAEVKTTLAQTDAKTEKKLDDIHTLVNSAMGVQLKLNAVSTRRLADLTQDPDDMAAADLAGKMLVEHESRQASVDSG